MKKCYLAFLLLLSSALGNAQTTLRIFQDVLFFDGYAATVSTPDPPPGVTRLKNYLYSTKLRQGQLDSIGTSLQMKVTVKASCDNYDRIGNVNMALVPPGSTTYNPNTVQRIEIARYITPFMNKNISPTQVPYSYNIDNIAWLLKDTSITNHFDIWMELELFGVPYAANQQVAGCAGRNDVFYGSLDFITGSAGPIQNNNVLMPLSFKHNFNNYNTNATDTLGETTLTLNISVAAALTDATIFFITSNHGANSGGEEYNRRNHYVYYDGVLKQMYKPGRLTCEPFRMYNTQPNGIYGPNPRSNAQWQSFSNWCPGDVIDIRKLVLGAVPAGDHKFMIRVPDAVFNGGEGNIPLSVYLHGKTSGTLTAPVTTTPPPATNPDSSHTGGLRIYPVPANDYMVIEPNSEMVTGARIVDMMGRVAYRNDNISGTTTVKTAGLPTGIYFLQVYGDGHTTVRKIAIAH